MNALTLILPGLLWPSRSIRAVLQDLELPGLKRLIHRATVTKAPAASADEAWLEAFGMEGSGGCARPRARGDGINDDGILCADPTHLMFNRDALVLQPPWSLEITANEAHSLIDSLNRHFGDIGQFDAPHPERWYLRSNQPLTAHTTPLADVIGRRIDQYLPAEPELRRLLNEIQMLFHHHPVNAARENAGQPAINSVWLWGEGLAQHPATPRQAVMVTRALARGLGLLAGVAVTDPPECYTALPPHTDALIGLDALERPALAMDIDGWREALASLDQHWLLPLADAVSHRQLDLQLVLPGDQGSARLRAHPPSFWPFLKRATSLPDFLEALQQP